MDKPILFNTSMVQALLDGRKTQTRRIVKAKSMVEGVTNKQATRICWGFQRSGKALRWAGHDNYQSICFADSPYGEAGALLWVRETWRPIDYEPHSTAATEYKNGAIIDIENTPEAADKWVEARKNCEQWPELNPAVWRPSIHMPRWASRLTLLVKDIRIERVQAISCRDVLAEGVKGRTSDNYALYFRELWNDINEPRGYGWDLNPWVWCLTFEVIHKNIDEVL